MISKADAFLRAAVSHHTDEKPYVLHAAMELLKDRSIAKAKLLTACVLGDVQTARAFLRDDPKSATKPAGPHAWPPILYLAFSRFLKFKPRLESNFVSIAKLLLKHGADPNSMFVHEGFNETPLYGAAGIANRPKLTKVLLDAGADPSDGGEKSGIESLYHSAEHLDNTCLKLILAKRPRKDAISHCLLRKLDFDDAKGTKLMLDHGADPNYRGPNGTSSVLHAIRRGRSVTFVKLLHRYGAKLDLADDARLTPIKLARRLGQTETVRFLEHTGVNEPADLKEQFLAACGAGDRRAARRLLAQNANLLREFGADELRILPDAAGANHLTAVRLMLDLGFDINARGDWDGAAIHHAAWVGHLAMTKLLIRRGADLHQKNGFGGDALHTAIHGAMNCRTHRGTHVIASLARAMKAADPEPYLKHASTGDPALLKVLRRAFD